jgi:TolB-like protein
MKKALISLCISVLILTSCSNQPEIEDEDLVRASYIAADSLLKGAEEQSKDADNAKMVQFDLNKTILVASFVNIDDMQMSSTFGRIVAEQIGSRVSQKGYKVIEMKLRNSVFVQERTGELLLSREILEISLNHDAHAVIVGTYAEGKETVYVTAKLVRANDGVILASHDYSLPVGPNTKGLLRNKRRNNL